MKSEGIDLLKLYAEWDTARWNAWLAERLRLEDVSGLVDTLRRLEMGMANLASQKLNVEKVNVQFLRWQRSIENTIKKIYEKQNPNPLFTAGGKDQHGEHLADKQRKRESLERFLKRVRY